MVLSIVVKRENQSPRHNTSINANGDARLNPNSVALEIGLKHILSIFLALKKKWLPIILISAGILTTGVVTFSHSDAMSPIDEWVYIDYLEKLPSQLIVPKGELIGEAALERMSCDGVKPYGTMGPSCVSSDRDPEKYPYNGVNSAEAYSPVYFWATWASGKAISLVTGQDDLDSWRLTGLLWLTATLLIFIRISSQLKIHKLTTLAIGLGLIASPISWWSFTYVSTDAPSIFFGGLLFLIALKIIDGSGKISFFILISGLAVAFKITNLLAVGLVALLLIANIIFTQFEIKRPLRHLMIFESPQRKQAFAALGVLIIAFAVQLSWMFIRSQMALEQQPESSQGISSDLDVMEIAMQMFNFIPGTITSNANISGTDLFAYRMPAIVFIPLSWLCIIGVIGAFSIKQLSIKMKSITLSTILAGVFFAPLLAISLSLILGSYYQIPPRYGASILLSFLISAGLLIQNKPASIFLLIYTVSLNILTIALAPLLAP